MPHEILALLALGHAQPSDAVRAWLSITGSLPPGCIEYDVTAGTAQSKVVTILFGARNTIFIEWLQEHRPHLVEAWSAALVFVSMKDAR